MAIHIPLAHIIKWRAGIYPSVIFINDEVIKDPEVIRERILQILKEYNK